MPVALAMGAFYVWLAGLFVWLWRNSEPKDSEVAPTARAPGRRLLGAVCVIATLFVLSRLLDPPALLAAYGAALLGGLVVVQLTGLRGAASGTGPSDRFVCAALLVGAVLLQVAAWQQFPPGLAEDETKKGLDCLRVLYGLDSLFQMGSLNHPNLPCVTMAPLLAWLGPGVAAVRAYPMLAAALSVVVFYRIARTVMPAGASVASAALFAASPQLLLFGHTLQGAEITVLELLLVGVSIDAARRRSFVSALMAGSALGFLLYDYLAVRALLPVLALIYLFEQGRSWQGFGRRFAVGLTQLGVAVAALWPLATRENGWRFLANPMQYEMAQGKGSDLSWIAPTLRLVLDSYHEGVAHHGALSHTQIGVLPLVLGSLFLLGVGVALARFWRPGPALALSIFGFGILPALLSGSPNVHRAIVALPGVYFLIGLAITAVGGCAGSSPGGRRLTDTVEFALVLAGGVASLLFYYGPAWSRVEDFNGFGGTTAQMVRELDAQCKLQPTMVTSIPVQLEFFARDQLLSGRLSRFGYQYWLPENDSASGLSLIVDAGERPIYWAFQQLLPGAQYRPFLGPADGNYGGAILAPPVSLPRVKVSPDANDTTCGGLMFQQARRVTAVTGGSLSIDGRAVGDDSRAAHLWFAAGLHSACASGRPHVWYELAGGKQLDLPLRTDQLYALAPRGWVHRAACAEAPGIARHLAIEPFLFHFNMEPPVTGCASGSVVHRFSTDVMPTLFPLRLDFIPVSGLAEVTADGQSLPIERVSDSRAWVVVPLKTKPIRLAITLRGSWGGGLLIAPYVARGEMWTLPDPYLFEPPVEDRYAADDSARW